MPVPCFHVDSGHVFVPFTGVCLFTGVRSVCPSPFGIRVRSVSLCSFHVPLFVPCARVRSLFSCSFRVPVSVPCFRVRSVCPCPFLVFVFVPCARARSLFSSSFRLPVSSLFSSSFRLTVSAPFYLWSSLALALRFIV